MATIIYTFTTADYVGPFVRNISPADGATGVAKDTLISFDVLDDYSGIDTVALDAYIDGTKVFEGPSTFISPWNGPSSSITFTTSGDGYEGYSVVLDSYSIFGSNSLVEFRVTAQDFSNNQLDEYFSFRTEIIPTNAVYYSDGYGLKKIDVSDLVGESQDAAVIILSTTTSPALPTDNISFIHGNRVDGYDFIITSFADAADSYGVAVIEGEDVINTYADGYRIDKAQMNDDGTLYLVNKTSNQVEVYYGADQRPGAGRNPDFIYNISSTPPLLSGSITDLHLAVGFSSVSTGSSRLYVGTENGVTRVDTYDRELDGYDGYGAGMDSYGVSLTYGVDGSGTDFEAIGGTIPNVVSISSDDARLIFFVATGDGYGNGGLTQISLSQNKKIAFITKASGALPSDNIRNVFGIGF